MLSQQQIIEQVKKGKKSDCIDGRDYSRLINFFPSTDWEIFGFSLKGGATPSKPRPFTEEEIKKQLASDVAFGFEKALDKRGISASLMNEVVKMWLWVLEDPLQQFEGYAEYGLPLLKAVAVKYGFPNEIGEASGTEYRYSSDAD